MTLHTIEAETPPVWSYPFSVWILQLPLTFHRKREGPAVKTMILVMPIEYLHVSI